jgi:hypothetical protein
MITRVSIPSKVRIPSRVRSRSTSRIGTGASMSISPETSAARPVAAVSIGLKIASVMLCSGVSHHSGFGTSRVSTPASRVVRTKGPMSFVLRVAKVSTSRAGASVPLATAQSRSMIIQLAMLSGKSGLGFFVTKSMVKSSTTRTSATGANHDFTSDCSAIPRS